MRFYVCNTGNLSWNVLMRNSEHRSILAVYRRLSGGVSPTQFPAFSFFYTGKHHREFRPKDTSDHRLQVQYVYFEFHGKSPYISLYLESSHASRPQAWAACVSTTEVMLSKIRGIRRKILLPADVSVAVIVCLR